MMIPETFMSLLRVLTADRTVRAEDLQESCDQIVLMRPN